MVDRFTLSDLRGRRAWWLLEVEAFGQTIRLATADLVIEESATSESHHFTGALPGTAFTDAVAFLQDRGEAGSLTVECVLPVDVPALLSAGHSLEGARATLARWVEGTDYSTRRLALVGRVQDVETGAAEEPVAFTVAEHVWEASTLIPSSSQQVDGTTWPDSITSLVGEEMGLAYPIVFGQPGVTSAVNRGWVTGSQGVWADHRKGVVSPSNFYKQLKLIIAGHRVTADRVMLSTDEKVSGERFVVKHTTDGLGQTVAYVDAYANEASTAWVVVDPDGVSAFGLGHGTQVDDSFQPSNASLAATVEFKPVFVGWYAPAAASPHVSGGMVGRSGQLVREAGDVLEELFAHLDRPLDRGRFAAAKPLLSAFKIDAFIDARVRPWDWFQANLRPLLPVSIVTGPSGLYPIVWRHDATATDAIAHLDVSIDPNIERASRLIRTSDNIRNDFSLKYAYSVRTDQYFKTIRLGAGPYDNADPDTLVSLHCQLSQSRYRYADGSGRKVSEELESVCIYDDATAAAVLSWRAKAYALGQVHVDYVVPENEWGWLERGVVVTLTDEDLHLTQRVAIVAEVQVDDSDTMGLRLLLLENPVRDGGGL